MPAAHPAPAMPAAHPAMASRRAAPGGGKRLHNYWIRVRYPEARGDLVLRTDRDWDEDVEPFEVRQEGNCFEFAFESRAPFVYCKPVLHTPEGTRWSIGPNYLGLSGVEREIFPTFYDDSGCSPGELRELECDETCDAHRYRVFCPPGYSENTLRRYPVLYMQDAQNLFFPDEAFGGEHWRVIETLNRLDEMNAIRKVIVVGVYPHDRLREYTAPGYEAYGRFMAEVLKPRIDRELRTARDSAANAVMGSSLGGVVSLYLAWEWPRSFGLAGCLSSTFGWRDDLRERIESEPRRRIKVYLDSGWPGDNFEVTRDMRNLLAGRGYREGRDYLYFAYPDALHNERSWAMRSHVPYQFFFGE